MASREQFATKTGFVFAAAGSAVGLGNIWGFPTITAANGGAAFVLVYLVLAFCLAYPALMAELVIGRHARSNAVTALRKLSRGYFSRLLANLTGFGGIITVSLILGFYSIVAGWMVAYLLGVGGMLIYGSYLSDDANLPQMGAIVTLVDVGIAFLAGMLIIPAVYVAQLSGADIFDANGVLISGPDMFFRVLPVLFDSMGAVVGPLVAIAFFSLMTIAAITSSIAMLEPAVSLVTEVKAWTRRRATWLIGTAISALALLIIVKMDVLFGFILALTTKYSQPVLGMMFCIFLGWIWNRNQVLQELRKGQPEMENSLFWKIWPSYVKWVCPILIFGAFVQKLLID